MAKLPTKGRPQLIDVDPNTLSDDVKATLRAKALEKVAQERQDAAMDAFLKIEIEKARRAHLPAEEMKYITLDMAGHSDRIMIDGTIYFHGQTYEVPKKLYDVLQDIISRGWEHEHEIGGANREFYRRPRSTSLRPGMENVATSQLMGSR